MKFCSAALWAFCLAFSLSIAAADFSWSGKGISKLEGLYFPTQFDDCQQRLVAFSQRTQGNTDKSQLLSQVRFRQMDALSYLLAALGDSMEGAIVFNDSLSTEGIAKTPSQRRLSVFQSTPSPENLSPPSNSLRRISQKSPSSPESISDTVIIHSTISSFKMKLQVSDESLSFKLQALGAFKNIFPLPYYLEIIEQADHWQLRFNPGEDKIVALTSLTAVAAGIGERFPKVGTWPQDLCDLQSFYMRELMEFGPLAAVASELNITMGELESLSGDKRKYVYSNAILIPKSSAKNIYLVIGNYLRAKSGLPPF